MKTTYIFGFSYSNDNGANFKVFLLDNYIKHKLLISEEWDILEEAMAENRTKQTARFAQNLPNLKGINFPFNYVLHLQPSSIQKCQIWAACQQLAQFSLN